MVESITLQSIEKVMKEIWLLTTTNDWVEVSLESLNVWRLNYPYNCYSLDLPKNGDVQAKGVKQLLLVFHMVENYSVEIFLEGQSLASYRMIKGHRSQTSGDAIRLDNLGKPI